MVLEAMLVASTTTVIAFVLILYIHDCQSLGKNEVEVQHPLQVKASFKLGQIPTYVVQYLFFNRNYIQTFLHYMYK